MVWMNNLRELLLLLAQAALLALLVQDAGSSAPASGSTDNEQALRLDLRAAGVPDGEIEKSVCSFPFLVGRPQSAWEVSACWLNPK